MQKLLNLCCSLQQETSSSTDPDLPWWHFVKGRDKNDDEGTEVGSYTVRSRHSLNALGRAFFLEAKGLKSMSWAGRIVRRRNIRQRWEDQLISEFSWNSSNL